MKTLEGKYIPDEKLNDEEVVLEILEGTFPDASRQCRFDVDTYLFLQGNHPISRTFYDIRARRWPIRVFLGREESISTDDIVVLERFEGSTDFRLVRKVDVT